MGVDGVEIDVRNELRPRDLSQTGVRHLRKMLDDWNLRVCAVTFPTRRGYHVAEDLDRRIEATKEAMRFAYALGASVVVNRVGRTTAESGTAEWRTLIEALTDLGAYGQRVGAWLAAETGHESGADLARLLEALPPGSLAVALDPAELILNGFSPEDVIRQVGQAIQYVQARDATRDVTRNETMETTLGRGSVDLPDLIGQLEEFGYRGYFTIERQRAEEPEEEIRQAVSYLRNL